MENSVSTKSILLIGRVDSTSVHKLVNEARSRDIVFDCVTAETVFHNTLGKFSCPWPISSRDIWSYDVYFFRGIGRTPEKLAPFLKQLAEKNKKVVEKTLLDNGFLPEDKRVPESKEGLYKVPNYVIAKAEEIESAVTKVKYPFVLKKIGFGSSMGRGVALINSEKEAIDFCKNIEGLVQIQDYHQIDFDTRVLVVGGVCVGGFNRHKVKGENFLTTRIGGERFNVVLTERQKAAAIEAAHLQGLGVAGIDMFESAGDLYIIEVNASPQFHVFETKTGSNAAKAIIDYLIS